jgi:ssDNA-binding Zn-finger/Zn-ribbon topoisomerase 1
MQAKSEEQKCPECLGATVLFKGQGLDRQYKVCSQWEKPGHLTLEEIRAKIGQDARLSAPSSGRWA